MFEKDGEKRKEESLDRPRIIIYERRAFAGIW